MRTFAAGLTSHLAGRTTSLATVVKITLAPGRRTSSGATALGFTDADLNLTGGWDGSPTFTYYANRGYWRFAMEFTDGLEANNTDAEWLLDSSGITEEDLRKEIFRGAKYELRFVNFKDSSVYSPIFKRGWIGRVTLMGPSVAKLELKGFRDRLQQQIGAVVTKNCPYDLGDANCRVALAYVTVTTTVRSVTSNRVFTVDPAGLDGREDWYSGGLITWNGGISPAALNERGRPAEIKVYTPGTSGADASLELFEAMPFRVGVGDVVTLRPGCDKTLATCRDRFGNVVNFGGFPFLRYDAAYSYAKPGGSA